MQLITFGASHRPLVGVYHPPLGAPRMERGVLLCPSIGHEYYRSHWAIRRLADRLSRSGFPTLRFDYHGMGDSSQDLSDVTSLEAWIKNIQTAVDELADQSGCACSVVVGLRFGGSLAAMAIKRIPSISQVVMWEPVLHGNRMIEAWRKMHRQKIELWSSPSSSIDNDYCEEILGSLFQKSLLREIDSFSIDLEKYSDHPISMVGSTLDAQPISISTMQDLQERWTRDNGGWSDLNQIETAWLPSEGPAAILNELASEKARLLAP